MATVVLPFPTEGKVDVQGTELLGGELYEKLPSSLKTVVENYPHLLEYLHLVPISQVGMPEYYPELSRKLGDIKEPNLIYPTNREGIFIHILVNHKDVRNSYIIVEPTLTANVDHLILAVDHKLREQLTKLVGL